MHPEERLLTRDDFLQYEDWLRHCHEGGIDPIEPEVDESVDGTADGHEQSCERYPIGWANVAGGGFYAQLYRATYGWTKRQYALTHEGYGVTDYLDGNHFLKAYRAVALANCRGRTMNAFLTITWSTVGVERDEHVARLQGELLESTRKWLGERGHWAAWLWVLERGRRRGLHSHMLLGIPSPHTHDFRAWLNRRLADLVGRPLLDTPDSKTMLLEIRGDLKLEPQWAVFRYLMKGLHPYLGWTDPNQPTGFRTLAQVAGIKAQAQGEVQVKRMGVSRDLDEKSFLDRYPSSLPPIDLAAARTPEDLYHDRYQRWQLENDPAAWLPSDPDSEEMEGPGG